VSHTSKCTQTHCHRIDHYKVKYVKVLLAKGAQQYQCYQGKLCVVQMCAGHRLTAWSYTSTVARVDAKRLCICEVQTGAQGLGYHTYTNWCMQVTASASNAGSLFVGWPSERPEIA